MKVIKPPQPLIYDKDNTMIFLAGSIEMGNAELWQDNVICMFNYEHRDVTFLNPRRADWDSSWEQKIENDKFREQVEWELRGLELCDLIIMYFDPQTKSPISLLELGLYAKSGKLIVICPKGFWRKGNVDIICKRYNIRTCDKLANILQMFDKYN